jgi:hypothetical protein
MDAQMHHHSSYAYDLATTPAGKGAGGCLTAKKGAYGRVVFPQWGAVFFIFFTFCYFLLLFLLLITFISFFLLLKQG